VPHVDPERWQASLQRLRDLRADGALTTEHVRLAARGLGVGESTVWRRLARGSGRDGDAPPGRRGPLPFQLTDTDVDAFTFYRGNVAYVHRARQAVLDGSCMVAGGPTPQFLIEGWASARPVSLRTLQQAFASQLTSGMRAGLTLGEAGRRRHAVHLDRPDVPRNSVWEMDHKELPILALPPRGPAAKPWLTSIVDAGTRVLLGWCIALYPSAATVLTALRMALVHDVERGPYGAVPSLVRVDQGLEFAASAVKQALAALCVPDDVLPGYQPHLKGKIERLNRTVEQTLLKGLPGYTDGARDAAGRLYGPLKDDPGSRAAAAEAVVKPWRIERLARRFAGWEAWYNSERPHSMLGGRTPLQAWNDDVAALHRIPAETLRHLLLAGKDKVIHHNGIHHESLTYLAPELHGRGGERVGIRFMPHDDRFIEVYLGGEHLCTAEPRGHLTGAREQEFRDHARAEAAELKRVRRRATRNARTELAPLTGEDGPAQESRLVPAKRATAAVRSPIRTGRSQLMATAARSDLLGLTEPSAVPAAPRYTRALDSPEGEDEHRADGDGVDEHESGEQRGGR
jgi:putative transposase